MASLFCDQCGHAISISYYLLIRKGHAYFCSQKCSKEWSKPKPLALKTEGK